jgi:hypothetical protein
MLSIDEGCGGFASSSAIRRSDASPTGRSTGIRVPSGYHPTDVAILRKTSRSIPQPQNQAFLATRRWRSFQPQRLAR